MGLPTEQKPAAGQSTGGLRAIPRTVVTLGIVSLFMDLSSEMIHSLLPTFLVTVLGVNALSVGIIEGIAEATASITKIFSGAISDWMRKRKLLVLIGYGLAAVTKPLFPLATGPSMVLIARFIDRIGKGIRGAPRDALIGDVTPAELRGTAFGLRQSIDTVGAFLGPLLAMLLMALSNDNFRLVFWLAVVPAFIAIFLIVFGIREPEATSSSQERRRFPIQRTQLARLSVGFWCLIGIAGVLTLARFSEAFLLLAAEHVGVAVALIPGVLVTMNVVYAATAYPFGRLSDRMSRPTLLIFGVGFLIAANLILATSGTGWQVLTGAALWGLHMGATQGLLSALVVDRVPANLRGTALGLYGLITGGALLAASVLAGWLWTTISPGATFIAGATFTGLALIGIVLDQRSERRSARP